WWTSLCLSYRHRRPLQAARKSPHCPAGQDRAICAGDPQDLCVRSALRKGSQSSCVSDPVTRLRAFRCTTPVLRKNSICAVIVMLFDGWLQVLEILVGQKPAVVVGFEPM